MEEGGRQLKIFVLLLVQLSFRWKNTPQDNLDTAKTKTMCK